MSKGKAESLVAIDRNIGILRASMLSDTRKHRRDDVSRLHAMAYGIHQQCRSLLNRRGGTTSP